MNKTTAASPTAMSMMEHLSELRMRVIRSMLATGIGMTVVLLFYDRVLDFMLSPYAALCARQEPGYCAGAELSDGGGPTLLNLDPISGLSTRMSVALYGGIVLAMPVLLWQLWRFIVPALHKNERRYAFGFVGSTIVLFLMGSAVAYFTLQPALEFLINWAGSDVQSIFEVKAYVRLFTVMLVAFGVAFTVPELLVFLQMIGVVSWRALLRQWRYATVGVFLLAAVITPSGDPIGMMALGIPLLVLYFLAVLIGWLLQRNRSPS